MELFLVIGVIAILVLFAVTGYARGFLRIVLSAVALLVAVIIATVLTDPVCEVVYDTSLYQDVVESAGNYVEENLVLGVTNVSEILSQDVLDNLNLPSGITETLNEQLEANASTLTSTEEITDFLTEQFARLIVKNGVFFAIFLLAFIAMRIVIFLADLVAKLPGLNTANRMFGLVLGLLEGLVVLWVCCLVITILSGTQTGQEMLQAINRNTFLDFIYSRNPLLTLIS
ncbi:MAG: CvpA family protein [Lachnospiraceae bacterium]|nr:CvpA family protein [Lachnospiraceae bacterium]